MKRTLLFTLVVAVSIGLTGCPLRLQRVTLNDQIKGEHVSFIVIGQTTFAEVLEKLGVPDQLKDSESGPIAQYDFFDVKYFKVDLLAPLPFIVPAVALVPGAYRQLEVTGGGSGSDHFRVFFDSNWIAQSYGFEIHSDATEFVFWPF